MPIRDRVETLETAKWCVLEGSYTDAIELIDNLLRNEPQDVDALCLKGEALELSLFQEDLSKAHLRPAHYDTRLADARACFDAALQIEPRNSVALRDLADHLKNVGDLIGARATYDLLLDVLRANGKTEQDEEFVDAIAERRELGG